MLFQSELTIQLLLIIITIAIVIINNNIICNQD